MEDNFNKHLGNKLKLRRLALGLTQTKVAKAINVTFQQIQKYEKGTNGVSSIRLLQLSNYLKVPINYFFEDFSEYLINIEKSKEGMTMIVVTHEMGFAKEVADCMIFMDEGKIVEKAATKEFFANPKSDRTKLFLSQIL